jgi:divalent metal cation (Fe/Co/Zn/Cd) transporter
MTDPTWNYVVLGVATLFDGGSFIIALRQFRRENRGRGIFRAMRESKDPSVFTVLCEDTADLAGIALALLGVLLSHELGRPYLDGAASIGIGLVLASVATFLVVQSRRLLVGEGADEALISALRSMAGAVPGVAAVRYPLTMQLGPNEVLLGLRIAFAPGMSADDITRAIARLEQRIREEHPQVRHLFIEAEALHGGRAPSQVSTSGARAAESRRGSSC